MRRSPLRTSSLVTGTLFVAAAFTVGCGDDAPSGNRPDPRLIEGGGIGDGEIDGVVNLYVIDDVTRAPIVGAEVRVGEVDGTTDDTGLFVAEGVKGPQQVYAKASGYRAEMWVAANGANMTMNLAKPVQPAAPTGVVTGSIDLSGVSVPAGHAKIAFVTYLQTAEIGDPANEIQQPAQAHVCGVGADAPVQTCSYSIVTRTGMVGLLALIVDLDPGTDPGSGDDTTTFSRWGYAAPVAISAGGTVANVTLDVLAATDNVTETVDFGTPPAGLTNLLALVSIETPEGVFQSPFPANMQMPSVNAPKLSAVGGTSYRLAAIAGNTAEPPTQSIVIRRGMTSATLNAGTWITPPTNVALTRTTATWTPVAGATVHSVEYTSGDTRILNVTVFDNSGSITLPEQIALPSGSVDARVQAIGATGFDVNNFELDRDQDKLDTIGATPAQVPN